MTQKTRNRLLTAFILALPFILFFSFLVDELNNPLPQAPPLPNPNGYDDLVKAGELVSANSDDFETDTLEQLRATAAINARALAFARTGFSNECRVPLEFTQAYAQKHLSDLADFKRLAQAMVTEGRLAEMEHRPNDAAMSYLDTVHLAHESVRGGTLIDALVGIAIEQIGTSHLQKLVDQLDAKSCRETAATLETLDSQRQTWDEIMQQEHDWSRRTFPGLRNKLARLMTRNTLQKMFKNAEQKYEAQQIRTRQLIIDLATRAYKLDKGKPPRSVTDLVTDYLKAIPQDPFTGTNMVYSPR